MKITEIRPYRDGGTICYILDDGNQYCINNRIDTWSKNKEYKDKIYLGYPTKDHSNLIKNQEEIKELLNTLLKELNNDKSK